MAEGNAASQRADKYPLEALGFLIDKQTIGDKRICCREYCKVSRQLLVLTANSATDRPNNPCFTRRADSLLADTWYFS